MTSMLAEFPGRHHAGHREAMGHSRSTLLWTATPAALATARRMRDGERFKRPRGELREHCLDPSCGDPRSLR